MHDFTNVIVQITKLFFAKRFQMIYKFQCVLPPSPKLHNGLYWTIASEYSINCFIRNDNLRAITLNRLIKSGASGIILHDGDEWVAHGFVAPGNSRMPQHIPRGVRKEMGNVIFYMHTRLEWRGKGLQKACISLILHSLIPNHHFSQVIAYTDVNVSNTISRKAFQSTGFKPCGTLRSVELRLPKIGSLAFGHWMKDAPHPPMDLSQ